MSSRTIHNAVPNVVAMYANKFGVQIQLDPRAVTEHTDGKSIVLPQINFDAMKEQGKSEDEIALAKNAFYGWAAHGCMHVRFSDFDLVNSINVSEFQFKLINILEDIRIERECYKLFPGSKIILSALEQFILEAGLYESVDVYDPPHTIVNAFVLYWGMSSYVEKTCLANLAVDAERSMSLRLGDSFTNELKAILSGVVQLKSTSDVYAMSVAIMNLIQDHAQQQPQHSSQDQTPAQENSDGQSGSPNSDSGQQSEEDGKNEASSQDNHSPEDQAGSSQSDPASDSDDDSVPSDSGNSDSDNPTDSTNGESGSESESKTDSSSSDSSSADSEQSQSDASNSSYSSSACLTDDGGPTSTEISNSFKELLGNLDQKEPDVHDKVAKLFNEINDQTASSSTNFYTYSDAAKVQTNDFSFKLVNEAKGFSSRIRQQLDGLVQASKNKDVQNTRTGKRLNNQAICRIVHGDTRIYRREHVQVARNTAVHVITDLSSSMEGIKASIAQQASLALAFGIEPLDGVSLAVTYFFGTRRVNPLHSVKDYDELASHRASAFFTNHADGSTPMTEAVWYAATSLLKRDEDRKILIVITDGQPTHAESMRHVMGLLDDSEISTYAIGINEKSVSNYFKDYSVINQVSDLQGALFGFVEKQLTN